MLGVWVRRNSSSPWSTRAMCTRDPPMSASTSGSCSSPCWAFQQCHSPRLGGMSTARRPPCGARASRSRWISACLASSTSTRRSSPRLSLTVCQDMDMASAPSPTMEESSKRTRRSRRSGAAAGWSRLRTSISSWWSWIATRPSGRGSGEEAKAVMGSAPAGMRQLSIPSRRPSRSRTMRIDEPLISMMFILRSRRNHSRRCVHRKAPCCEGRGCASEGTI